MAIFPILDLRFNGEFHSFSENNFVRTLRCAHITNITDNNNLGVLMFHWFIYHLILFHSGPSRWLVVTENVCYGGPNVTKFSIDNTYDNRTLYALRLVHLSGYLTCAEGNSRWGCREMGVNCEPHTCHDTNIITDQDGESSMMLDIFAEGPMTLPGFSIDDDVLILKENNWFMNWLRKLSVGQTFVLRSSRTTTGTHCIRIEGSFMG